MIDHSKCDHERTSKARARCRRQQVGGKDRASTRTVDFSKGGGGKKASTPRDRDKQCDICGVERITMRGTPPLENIMLYVGDKCSYYLNDATDIVPLD